MKYRGRVAKWGFIIGDDVCATKYRKLRLNYASIRPKKEKAIKYLNSYMG